MQGLGSGNVRVAAVDDVDLNRAALVVPRMEGVTVNQYETRGQTIRLAAKELMLDFMRATSDCQPGQDGMRLSPMFRACGFDWGEYPKATSSNQQYWVVALVRELEAEGKVEHVSPSGPWRLR